MPTSLQTHIFAYVLHSLHHKKMEVMTSSPPHLTQYHSSAPSSPSRISQLYRDFDYFLTLNNSQSPPSLQKSDNPNNNDNDDDDFAFLISQDLDTASLTAEELFDGGKIRPLKADLFTSITKSPIVSHMDKKSVDQVLSQKKNRDPPEERRRGRDTTPAALIPSSSGRRCARSLSPHQGAREGSVLSSKSSKKWKLRDLLLFRSASEGRGSDKDPLRKYSVLRKKDEDVRDSPTGSSRRGPISPHELHYAVKKAQSQDLKKRTFLPYRQGILGRLAGLGSHTR